MAWDAPGGFEIGLVQAGDAVVDVMGAALCLYQKTAKAVVEQIQGVVLFLRLHVFELVDQLIDRFPVLAVEIGNEHILFGVLSGVLVPDGAGAAVEELIQMFPDGGCWFGIFVKGFVSVALHVHIEEVSMQDAIDFFLLLWMDGEAVAMEEGLHAVG